MSHQDDFYLRKNISTIKSILEVAVPESVASYLRHGNAAREPAWLASVALTCFGWVTAGTLGERVSQGCRVVGQVFDREETITRQGLMKALGTCGPDLVKMMIGSLANHVQSLKGYWTQQGKVNVAVDGSKFAAPRTKENQDYFAATAQKKRRTKSTRRPPTDPKPRRCRSC